MGWDDMDHESLYTSPHFPRILHHIRNGLHHNVHFDCNLYRGVPHNSFPYTVVYTNSNTEGFQTTSGSLNMHQCKFLRVDKVSPSTVGLRHINHQYSKDDKRI